MKTVRYVQKIFFASETLKVVTAVHINLIQQDLLSRIALYSRENKLIKEQVTLKTDEIAHLHTQLEVCPVRYSVSFHGPQSCSDPSIDCSSGPKPTAHHYEAGDATHEGDIEFAIDDKVQDILTSNVHR